MSPAFPLGLFVALSIIVGIVLTVLGLTRKSNGFTAFGIILLVLAAVSMYAMQLQDRPKPQFDDNDVILIDTLESDEPR